MRKSWMLPVIALGCLIGLPGCSVAITSLLAEGGLSILVAILGGLFTDLIGTTAT